MSQDLAWARLWVSRQWKSSNELMPRWTWTLRLTCAHTPIALRSRYWQNVVMGCAHSATPMFDGLPIRMQTRCYLTLLRLTCAHTPIALRSRYWQNVVMGCAHSATPMFDGLPIRMQTRCYLTPLRLLKREARSKTCSCRTRSRASRYKRYLAQPFCSTRLHASRLRGLTLFYSWQGGTGKLREPRA